MKTFTLVHWVYRLLLVNLFFSLHSSFISQHATQWRNEFLLCEQHYSCADITLLANLCYHSYQRSWATCAAQQAGISALTHTYHMWHNLTATRRNPSTKAPYTFDASESAYALELFKIRYTHYRTISTCYAQALEHMLHGNIVQQQRTAYAMDSLREHARTVVAHAIGKAPAKRGMIGSMLATLKEHASCVYTLGAQVAQGMWHILPEFASSAFVQTDREYNKASQYGWEHLLLLEQTGVEVWDAIESTRAELYQRCYNAVYEYYRNNSYHVPLYNLFEPDGTWCSTPHEILPCGL